MVAADKLLPTNTLAEEILAADRFVPINTDAAEILAADRFVPMNAFAVEIWVKPEILDAINVGVDIVPDTDKLFGVKESTNSVAMEAWPGTLKLVVCNPPIVIVPTDKESAYALPMDSIFVIAKLS
jgi:hypothetical protein